MNPAGFRSVQAFGFALLFFARTKRIWPGRFQVLNKKHL